jgi:hypothetical protein
VNEYTVVTANVVPNLPVLVTMMMETIRSSKCRFLTRVTRRNIAEDGILHSDRGENLKFYIVVSIVQVCKI